MQSNVYFSLCGFWVCSFIQEGLPFSISVAKSETEQILSKIISSNLMVLFLYQTLMKIFKNIV